MTIRVHHPDQLAWQTIGDIAGPVLDRLDPSELGGRIAWHEPGDAETMQLLEMWFEPETVVVPHAHGSDEIVYVLEGSFTVAGQTLVAGSSMYIPANATGGGRTGPEPCRMLSFRARPDHSWEPRTAPPP